MTGQAYRLAPMAHVHRFEGVWWRPFSLDVHSSSAMRGREDIEAPHTKLKLAAESGHGQERASADLRSRTWSTLTTASPRTEHASLVLPETAH